MAWTDWIVPLGLMALVLRQLRGRRLTAAGLLWPVLLVLWAAAEHLRGIPPRTGDLLLTGALTATGAVLGAACGLLTRVREQDGAVVATATAPAAALWIAGVGGRLAFGVVATHGGGPAIAQASRLLHLHSAQTWPTALVATALAEVLTRTAVLAQRLRAVRRGAP